ASSPSAASDTFSPSNNRSPSGYQSESVVEHLPNVLQQLYCSERLLNEPSPASDLVLCHSGLVGLARHVQDLQSGRVRPQPLQKLRPATSRHHYVGHDQVDRIRLFHVQSLRIVPIL